jgi:hypothetical protein
MFPLLVAEFKSDSTFVYKKPYLEKFGGTWEVKNDTVFLYSDTLVSGLIFTTTKVV